MPPPAAKEFTTKASRARQPWVSDFLFLSTDCSPQAVLVSLTTSVTLSRISFTSVQIASRVEEALAEATFDKMVSPSLTDTYVEYGSSSTVFSVG